MGIIWAVLALLIAVVAVMALAYKLNGGNWNARAAVREGVGEEKAPRE